MLLDIFSSFDDHHNVINNLYHFMWVSTPAMLLSSMLVFWSTTNKTNSLLYSTESIVKNLTSRTKMNSMGGTKSFMTTLFVTLIILNLLGLTPYTFSTTSHLAINLTISLPLWTTVVMMSLTYDTESFMAHLQPMGSPAPLNPFLCLIELVSLMVRPITLAVRLTANLSTGHILVALLGVGFANSPLIIALAILALGLLYFIFEMAVCLIQAYIFTLLPTLYSDEHPSN